MLILGWDGRRKAASATYQRCRRRGRTISACACGGSAVTALVGVQMAIDKVGTGAWCRSMPKALQTANDYFEE